MTANLPRLKASDILRAVSRKPSTLRELKKVDPKTRYVLLFPHSDAAHVGMGFKLLNIAPAEDVYNQASELVKTDLLKLCLKGPKDELLGSLENRNIATFVTSHATIAKLAHETDHVVPFCKAAAGFGIGLINSLVFSGCISFEDGLDLVRQQSQAMNKAASIVPNAKLLLKVKPATRIRRLCQAAVEHCIKLGVPQEIAICSVTKKLSPLIIEIGGHIEAIKFLENEGPRLFDFIRCDRIKKYPFAFNTHLMNPAREYMSAYIDYKLKENQDYLKDPETCSVYSSTSGCRLRWLKSIKRDLIDYPVKSLQVEQLLNCLYMRPRRIAQPNTLVVWDKSLLKTLSVINRLAFESAKLISA